MRVSSSAAAPDVLLTDLRLPDGEGIELVRELDKPEATEVIIVTGHATVDSAVAALRAGASDYLVKPADLERVQAVLRHAKKTSALQHEIGALREELRKLGRFGRILGSSPRMQVLYDQLSRVAPTSATVMLIGESGTGKELARRRCMSSRGVVMLPSTVELRRRRSTTHRERAVWSRARQLHGRGPATQGLFRACQRRHDFLDEITEMPMELQVKLLRSWKQTR